MAASHTTRATAAAAIDLCLCGTDTSEGPCEAAHWNSPTGSVSVAFSCSPACADAIEALRGADGRLTAAMVATARQARQA